MNTATNIRRIRVAAVQTESKHGLIEANHAHAMPFIEKAAHEGAKLIVLPELFSTCYIPNQAIWDAAEPQNGSTVRWLKQTAKRLGIYLGAGSWIPRSIAWRAAPTSSIRMVPPWASSTPRKECCWRMSSLIRRGNNFPSLRATMAGFCREIPSPGR